MLFKPSLIAAAFAIVTMSFVFATEVDCATDADGFGARRPNPKFACVVKSTSCRTTRHYVDVDFTPELKLDVCYHKGFFKNWWGRIRLGAGHGMFVNTFYVDCPTNDKKCIEESRDWTSDSVTKALTRAFDGQTDCDAMVRCYPVDQVNDKCFPKEED